MWETKDFSLTVSGIPYTGPGDLVSGAYFWAGLRAYSVAAIGSNCIKLRRDSDNTTQIFITLATGALDVASITTFKGSANLFVDTLYDQSGNGRHFSQATTTSQPNFTLSVLGSLPMIQPLQSNNGFLSGPTFTYSQPYSYSSVVNFVEGAFYGTVIVGTTSGGGAQLAALADNKLDMYAGTNAEAPAADGSFHAWQAVFNGASSISYIDGTSNTVNPNTGGSSGANATIGTDGGSGHWNGYIGEVGVWTFGFNSTQQSNLNSNQRTYYGF